MESTGFCRIIDQVVSFCVARLVQNPVSTQSRVRGRRRIISGEAWTEKKASWSYHLDRHLNQVLWTMDGNFQLNRMKKNSDPDDVSLCQGRAYFPLESDLQQYLKIVPITKEVRCLSPGTTSITNQSNLEIYLHLPQGCEQAGPEEV